MLEHIADFLRYSGDVNLWRWWLRPPPVDADGMRREVELALAQRDSGVRMPFSIFNQEKAEHIGSTSLWHVERTYRSFEIGSTWLATPFHGTGVNRECKQLLLRYGFEELGMNRAVLQTDELNTRSRRAIEKLGFRFEGIMREDKVTWNGRVRSSALYSLLRNEWVPNQQPPPRMPVSGTPAANATVAPPPGIAGR
jgi:RimJ/RimL family protein N-acetyltransferase